LQTGNVSFIRMVGSEFVQKYLGEGPRMVRDVFRMAKENAPSIIFIDEIDAIATKRYIFMYISTERCCPPLGRTGRGRQGEREAGRLTNCICRFVRRPYCALCGIRSEAARWDASCDGVAMVADAHLRV
jgi:hypothetical protein